VQETSPCPADLEEIAEAYVMGSLPHDEVLAFEDHYAGCPACATVLQEAAVYVTAVRGAARELRAAPPR